MTVKTGRHIIRRDGQVVDAEASWKIGPAVSSSSITGASASATWGRPELVSVMETDHTDHDYNGHPVEIDWQDADGTTRVFTGRVQSTSGGSLELPQSQLTDGTDRLSRKLDLRPMAYTLPVHPINAGHGGRKRHVGLFGIWFTHQAMVTAGFDPGVPMHWSSVWYQSMCGSVATVPDADHAYASRGDLRTAYRTSDPDLAPGFVQDENQVVAEDVYTFGVTASPRPNTETLPWQLTWDLPIVGGNDGELVLRNLDTSAGLAVKWSTNNMSFYKHNATGTQELLGTVVRDRDLETGDKRWSVIASPSGSSVIVRTDARGEVARWEGAGTVHPLPTGKDGLCTLRTTVPGRIGTTAITRGNRHYMTTEPPKGKIMRHSLVGTSLPGWPSMPDQEAGRILTDQADAHRGLRGQPLWSWVDHNGLLVNTDFDTLAARPVVHEFDTRPDSGALGLDGLTWGTDIPGAPFSKVQVTSMRMSMSLRDRPTLMLSEGTSQGLADGDEYVEFLNAESGTTWFEPDLRPLMAGWPYPSPPYDPRYKNNLNREEKSWVGGHRFERDSGERRGWLHPYQLSWTVDAAGHVHNAMRQITPETVIVEGTANLPQGPPVQDASTSPDPGSEGLFQRRKEQPFPQLRGYGLGRELEMSVDFPIGDVDERHSPFTHDCGWWIQSNTGLTAIGSAMLEQISRPTPTRSAKVEQSGWVKAGEKVLLRERRRNGYVIEEEIVVTPVEGETNSSDDSMTITGIVTARRVIQTDPDAPPVDEEEEWVTPPPTVPPAPPRSTIPPRREDDPGDPGDPPGAGPVKPSAPTLTYDPHGLLVVTWDGQNAAGGSAVTDYFGSAEVALGKDAVPEEVVGPMRAEPDGTFLYSEPSIDYGTQWYTRIRIVDRWGRVSPWSDGAGPVEVVPLVDPEQFEDLRELLDDAAEWIAETGAELDIRLTQAQEDLEAAEGRLDDAETRLGAAEGEINDASVWIAETGAELGTNLAQAQEDLDAAELRIEGAETRLTTAEGEIADASAWIDATGAELGTNLAQAQQDIDAAEARLEGAETRLGVAEGEIADASSWIDGTGAQLGTNLAAAQDALNAAFPSGVFDVDAAIDAAVAGAGGNVTTYSNITEANKPGPAPTSTTGRKSGDIHRNRNSSTYEVYAEWMLGANGNWQPANFGDSILRSLDVGKITGGSAAFEQFVSNNLTSNQAVINDLWTNVVRSRKITTDMLIVGSGENMIPWNPAGGLAPHEAMGTATAQTTVDDDLGHVVQIDVPDDRTNSWGLAFRFRPDTPSRTGLSYDHDIVGGESFRFRVGVGRGGSYPREQLKRWMVYYYSGDGGHISSVASPNTITGPYGADPEYLEWTTTAPDNAAFMRVYLQANNPGLIFLHDASIKRAADASLIVDGAVTAKKITITGDENNPDEAGLVANIASILHLTVDNLYVPGTSTIETGIINELWTQVVRSRKITTDMLIVGSGTNHIVDPNFTDATVKGYRAANSTMTGAWNTNANIQKHWYGGNQAGNGTFYFVSAAGSVFNSLVPVTPGEVWKIRATVNVASPGSVRFVFNCMNYDGHTPFVTFGHAYTSQTGVREIEHEFTIPEGMSGIVPGLQFMNPTTAYIYGGTSLVRMSDSSLIVDGAITAKKITITGDENNPDEAGLVASIASIMELDVGNLVALKGTIDVGVINELWTKVVRSRKITTDMLIVGSGENIFPDPWFQDLDGWAGGNVDTATDSEAPGGRRLTLLNRDVSQYSYYHNIAFRGIQLKAGHKYKLRYAARRGGSAPHSTSLRFYIAHDGTNNNHVIPYPTSFSYEYYEAEITAPADLAGGCTMAFWRSAVPDGGNSVVYVADVSLVSMTDASLIVDGAVTAKKITITGDPDNPDEVGLVANMASILHLTAENFFVTGTATIEESIINTLWTQVVRSRKITTDMLLVGRGINLLVDPGFLNEDLTGHRIASSTGNWSLATGLDLPNRVRSDASASTQAFRFGTAEERYVPIESGNSYLIRWQARRGSGMARSRPAIRYRNQDGSLTYTAGGTFTALTTAMKWYEFVWTAPDSAVAAEFEIQVEAGSTTWTNFTNPLVSVDGASLIVDGTIAARHIDAESIAAEVGEFVEINANQIKAGTLSAAVIMTGTLTLSSTNGKIRTGGFGARAEMDTSGFHLYDSLDRLLFDATIGGVKMIGELHTGTGAAGVSVEPDGSRLGQGLIQFSGGTQGGGEISLVAQSGYELLEIMGPGGANLQLSKFGSGSLNDRARLEAHEIYLEAGTGGVHVRGTRARIEGYVTAGTRANPAVGISGNAITITSVNSQVGSENNEMFLQNNGATWISGVGFGTTTTNTANVHAALDGRIRRSTSLSKHKLAQEDFTDLEAIKALRPVTWIDRADSEAYAAALWSGDEEALKGIGQLRRQVGLIAEEVAETAPILANYDNDGSLFGVSYERVASASLLWHQESDRRHDATEAEIRALREELDALRP